MVHSLLLKKTDLGKGFHLKPHFQLTTVINYRQTTKNKANALRASLQAGCEGSWERSCLHLCLLPELCICTPGSAIFPTSPPTQSLPIKLSPFHKPSVSPSLELQELTKQSEAITICWFSLFSCTTWSHSATLGKVWGYLNIEPSSVRPEAVALCCGGVELEVSDF